MFVVVINTEKVAVTGNKEEDKVYYWRNHPGGINSRTVKAKRETGDFTNAVKGICPRDLERHAQELHVYTGAEHSHDGQAPQPLEI